MLWDGSDKSIVASFFHHSSTDSSVSSPRAEDINKGVISSGGSVILRSEADKSIMATFLIVASTDSSAPRNLIPFRSECHWGLVPLCQLSIAKARLPRQIPPSGINRFNKLYFLLATPALYLFFSLNCFLDTFMLFVIH